jgi:molecular chaperone DnaK
MVNEAQRNASQDNRRREVIQARNEADTTIYQAEKSLRDLGDKVAQADRASVESKMAELKSAMAGENVQQIRSLIGELQQATLAIGQSTSNHSGSTGPQSGESSPVPDGSKASNGWNRPRTSREPKGLVFLTNRSRRNRIPPIKPTSLRRGTFLFMYLVVQGL